MAKQIPLRQCVGCREMKQKTELVRIIRTPEGDVCVDKTGKKNGRGAYICQNPACLEKAKKTNALNRALKLEIQEEIYQTIMKEMV